MSQPTPVSSNLKDIVERKLSRDGELSALGAIAAIVNRSTDLNEILNNALAATFKVTKTDAGGIFVLDEETKELRLVAHSDDCFEGRQYTLSNPQIQQAVGFLWLNPPI